MTSRSLLYSRDPSVTPARGALVEPSRGMALASTVSQKSRASTSSSISFATRRSNCSRSSSPPRIPARANSSSQIMRPSGPMMLIAVWMTVRLSSVADRAIGRWRDGCGRRSWCGFGLLSALLSPCGLQSLSVLHSVREPVSPGGPGAIGRAPRSIGGLRTLRSPGVPGRLDVRGLSGRRSIGRRPPDRSRSSSSI